MDFPKRASLSKKGMEIIDSLGVYRISEIIQSALEFNNSR